MRGFASKGMMINTNKVAMHTIHAKYKMSFFYRKVRFDESCVVLPLYAAQIQILKHQVQPPVGSIY